MGVVINFPGRLLPSFQDSRLDEPQPPPCQSCLCRVAQVRRVFDDGEAFDVCEECL